MKRKQLYIFLICTLALASCEERPQPFDTVEENVFGAVGNVDGQVTNIYAGTNDFYMSTYHDVDASSNVIRFHGNLARTCGNCPESMHIVIRNDRFGTDVDPESALGAQRLRFAYDKVVTSGFRVILEPEVKGNGPVTHLWDFGDGTFSSEARPDKIFTPSGSYQIKYTATFQDCSSSMMYPVNLSPELTGQNNLGFGYTYISGDTVLLSTDSSFANIRWDLGDGTFSTNKQVLVRIGSGKRMIKLFKFAANDTIQVWKNIASPNYLLCNSNFSYVVDPLQVYNPPTADVTVEWTDASGRTYSSSKVKQTAGNTFRIVGSSPYMPNEKGQPTRKLTLEFDCLLSDGVRTISMKNMQAVIAVAHP